MVKYVGGFILMLVVSPVLAAGSAPFCVYGSGGAQCFYFDIQSCQSAAQTFNGICAPNNQTQQSSKQQPQIQNSDIAGSMQRGYAAGHEARLRQAQIENVELQNQVLRNAQTGGQSIASGYIVFYKCPGSSETTLTPAVGCVVEYVLKQ